MECAGAPDWAKATLPPYTNIGYVSGRGVDAVQGGLGAGRISAAVSSSGVSQAHLPAGQRRHRSGASDVHHKSVARGLVVFPMLDRDQARSLRGLARPMGSVVPDC